MCVRDEAEIDLVRDEMERVAVGRGCVRLLLVRVRVCCCVFVS